MTKENDWVLDPFLGTGTSIIAAIKNNRKGIGSEVKNEYLEIANERINQAVNGTLKTRPLNRPVYNPESAGNKLIESPWKKDPDLKQSKLLDFPVQVAEN